MNDQQLENKVRQDAVRLKKDLNTLVEDSAARLNRFELHFGKVAGKTKEELTAQVEDGIAQLSKGFEKLTGDAMGSIVDATATAKKDVGHRLYQYDTKAKKLVARVPDEFSKNVARYSWVGILLGLALGFLLGSLIKPARQPLG